MTLKSNRMQVEAALRADIRRKLSASGIVVQNRAREKCPVDTGQLRNSITNEVEENRVTVGTNVEYAPFVHNGSRGRMPKPFLVDGLTESKGDLSRIWGEKL